MNTDYELQVLMDGGWANDASLLGHGLSQADNRFESEAAAHQAIEDLVTIAGFDRALLRAAPIEA